MLMRSAAAPTSQRPERSEEGDGSSPVEGWLRIFVAAASLALLPLSPIAPLYAAAAEKPPAAARPPVPAPPDTPRITLDAGELPAAGSQKTLLTVDRFGRYSVRVENAQGSSVEVVDRMAGSLGKAGEVGTESGRLDLFLDRGQYQVRVESAEKGTGKVRIKAQSFQERRNTSAAAPRLVETRLVQESLDDLEQVSYWLEIGERRGVRLEAAGRSLADLRLWRDGSWLDGTAPRCQQIQPVVGQPLWRCRLAATLEPGLYLLTAYGGAGQPWAESSDEHPFYLRWGEPLLPESGRRRYVVSPFGEDHFRLPGKVNFFRLELPEARPATLGTGWVRGGSPYDQAMAASSGAVTKESLPPAVEVRAERKPANDAAEPAPANAEGGEEGAAEEVAAPEATPPETAAASAEGDEGAAEAQGGDPEGEPDVEREVEPENRPEKRSKGRPAASAPEPGPPAGPLPWELVATVGGTPGQAYVLQHFEQKDVYRFSRSGPHWVSSVHAGAAEDSVDATAVITDTPPTERERYLTSAAVPLDLHSTWSRRFNFQEALTLFLEIKEAGTYRAVTSGADARARVEPFLISRPEHYEPPPWQGASSAWSLDAGFYVLSLEPQSKGILTLTLRPAGKAGQDLPVQARPVAAAVRFAPLALVGGHDYAAYLNHQPGVTAGLVVRPWPVDLGQPLPVAQKPGEAFEIPFHIAAAGTLRAEPDDGSKLDVAADGGPWMAEVQLVPGDHTVAVRHERPNTVTYSLWVEPAALQASTPLPALPDAALNALPKLPVLATGAPRYLDLARGQRSTYLLRAGKPGLYAVRSTGLLATAGTVRTRTVPALRRDAQNGVGRNFLVQQYLREGDYQVTVAALGRSRGHAGLILETTEIADGGELRAGRPGHFTLPAGQAVFFRVAVPEAGHYTLRALGLGFKLLCRFEDADGWPLTTPNLPADLSLKLAAGSYRLVLLPQPVEARALVLLEKETPPRETAGHGPHPLPLETRVEHLWVEPEGPEGLSEGAPRPPDLWRFELPAEVHVAVELTDEMQGRLSRLDPPAGTTATEIGVVLPGRAWKGELPAGHYQLAAECSRRNSRVRYKVAVHTEELVAGLERQVTAPTNVPVAVGREGLVELTSIAPEDVRARLLDATGTVVAANDDRPDDWNFLLFQRLAPGNYSLRVEPVGKSTAEVRIAMRTPAEVEQPTSALPIHDSLQLGSDVLLRSLPIGPRADLLLVAARSKDSLGLSVEALRGEVWRTVGTSIGREVHLEIPLVPASEEKTEKTERPAYRLRLWSLDRHETPVRLSATALTAPRLGERELARGAALPALPPGMGFEPALAAAAVEIERPGVFRFVEPAPDLRGTGGDNPLGALGGRQAPESAVLSAPGERFWLVREGKGSRKVQAERVIVMPGTGDGLGGGAQFPVPDGLTVTVDLGGDSSHPDGPLLALATAPFGQPGVEVVESDAGARASRPAATAMAVGSRTAISVALAPRHPVARVWQAQAENAGNTGDASGAEELRLAGLRFPVPETAKADWGVSGGHLDGIAARRLDLPAGPRQLRLALGEATVAVLSRGDTVLSTHWQGGAPFEELVESSGPGGEGTADRLTLLHLGPGIDPYTVELLPRAAGGETLALGAGAPFERALDRAGILRIALPEAPRGAGDKTLLHLRGAGSEAVLLGGDGSVSRGVDLPAGPRGVALVRHGTGLFLAWLGGPGEETAALWPAGPRPAPVAVRPPASVPLAGRFAELALAGQGPRVLHLRTAQPLTTLLHRADGSADEVEVHMEAGRLDAFLPPGEARLGLRSLAGASLSGVAEITETPVTPIAEGLGPELLLPAGGSRWFSFHVERQGPVGVGARAGSDSVEIELYDRAGRRLPGVARGGVVRMEELAPGDYLLALRSPAGAAPVKVRPAVAGLVLPDTGPPADVIQKYLHADGAEEAPESSSGSSGSSGDTGGQGSQP